MPVHVVQIGKHRFVCGLFWQSLSRPRELRKEAVELGRRVKFDLMVLRKDYGTAQVGYANTSEGVRPGMLSLGAAVSKTVAVEGAHYDGRQQPVNSWLGAFKLPDDRWAYFAVRDENFLPTGDFAGTKEEVIERLNVDYALGGWNVVFGDEELRSIGFHNFHARRIGEFFELRRNGGIRVHRWWALEPVGANHRLAILAAASVLGAVAIAGSYLLVDRFGGRSGAGMLPSAVDAARKVAGGDPPPPPPHPWPGEALPADFLRACAERLQHITPGGWLLDGYECDGGLASHAWKRGASVVAHLLELVPDAVVALDGTTARHALPLGAIGSARDEALLPAKAVLASVVSDLQSLGLKPEVTAVPVPPPPPRSAVGLADEPPHGPPDWQTFKVVLKTSGLPPGNVVRALDQPGVRLTKASFNGDEWSIEGVIYAK